MLGNEGRFENMQIYSLLNLYNVTRSSNDWNELWVLETDGTNYYYAIFYAFNNDHSSLRYAYELKLNDLSTRYTETYLTVSANWYLGTPTPIPEFSAPLVVLLIPFILLSCIRRGVAWPRASHGIH
jgi:hypothetical protein